MTFLRGINTNFQFPFRFTFKRTENVLPAAKKKKETKNSKNGNHVWRSFPKMADWPALFAERKRFHGREISLAPMVSRYPAVRFVHGI